MQKHRFNVRSMRRLAPQYYLLGFWKKPNKCFEGPPASGSSPFGLVAVGLRPIQGLYQGLSAGKAFPAVAPTRGHTMPARRRCAPDRGRRPVALIDVRATRASNMLSGPAPELSPPIEWASRSRGARHPLRVVMPPCPILEQLLVRLPPACAHRLAPVPSA